MRRRLLLMLAAAGVALVAAPSPAAAGDVTFGESSGTAEFGVAIEFVQDLTTTAGLDRVEILLELPGSIGPLVEAVVPPPGGGSHTLRHTLLLADGHILPNTTLTARWRVVDADGAMAVGPPFTLTYKDDRIDWQTLAGDVVRVHWHEGGADFGRRALEIGDRAVRETGALLGVSEDEPVDFFVYADEGEFYDALGPGTRENVGGQANAEIRTLFGLIPASDIDDPWVDIVIPHELVHLVFDTAVDNPYHYPPRWLNEGLAVYLTQGYAIDDRLRVEQAARDGSLIPLDGLTGQFPTTRDRFFLAYAESVAAVDFLIRTHGEEALVRLIRSYADGVTDDEAFEAATGQDVTGFDAAWRDDLGAVEPAVHGPQPAPAGPLPAGWLGVDGSPPPSPRPGVDGPDRDGGTPASGIVTAAALLAAAAVGGFLIWRRRRAARGPLWRAAPGDRYRNPPEAPP